MTSTAGAILAGKVPAFPPESIRVRGLTKRYGSVEAVRAIDFDVCEGEIFGLLGPNGAGKTTTLECILGLRTPDAGSISVNGVDALGCRAEAKQRVGAQLQPSMLQDNITPRQALRLFASFYRRPSGVEETLVRFGLVHKAEQGFVSLSSGEKQRLFLALAFINDPLLLVLDEPTTGLDPQSRRDLHALIREARSAGRAVLLSSHHLEEAHALCDRIAILDHGRIIASAKPDQLIAASKATRQVRIRAEKRLEEGRVLAFPGVVSGRAEGDVWILGSRDVNATVVAAVQFLDRNRNALLELETKGPTLEDVFIELTGRPWAPEKNQERSC